ncbi:MAG TPA: hypothetical protein VH092_11020 [Urbifossiella sp.]|jgi:hypothetical protein|nr:hypothetical protein [Urbifossiella sp.]
MNPLIKAIQARTAAVAISPSTVRGQGEGGVVDAAREFLTELDLHRFGVGDAETFRAALREATNELKAAFPAKARSWGLARKCLNIFLRDALYTCYLRDEYDLALAEEWYELPLDSVVVKAMKKKAPRRSLPQWLGVKHLTPDDSTKYQVYALTLAEKMGITRAHLDTYLWVEGRKIKPAAAGKRGSPVPAPAKG